MPLEKVVKDFMHPLGHYPYVSEKEPVKKVLKLLSNSKELHAPFIIVIRNGEDGHGTVRGFISPPEVVFGIAEHFLKGAERIGPIFWEGQLQAECMESFNKKVKEIMTPFKTCINESEMILEAVFSFHKHQINSLPVVREKEVVGIIHLEDILIGIAETLPE
ncbi:MAG: CBS domain-containing protein [Desulfococcaceae bacterium]|jgi:CBS domain-containing protein|nr:CBS domain-containing protein [Desulfococcaceae bacterium]